MNATIEKLKANQSRAEQDYADLIGRFANNQAVDETEAAGVLCNVGRSAADLEAEVNRFHRMAELRGIIAECEASQRALRDKSAAAAEVAERERAELFHLRDCLEKHAADAETAVAAGRLLRKKLTAAQSELVGLQQERDSHE